MKNTEVMELAKKNGVSANRKTIFNWRRGFYTVRGMKKWYFEDHTRLPFEESVMGKGYGYSESAVRAWLKMIISR
jgi:hypothetical protein